MEVRLADGVSLFVESLGDGFPLVVLHGGPGFGHSMFRPWLDPLADEFRLLYVDGRDSVDAAALSLEVFAHDVDLLAEALRIDRFALLGHSFGAIVATAHAVELGTAAAYVISAGAGCQGLEADVASSPDFDLVPYLHHVRRPVLVISGEHDLAATPRAARALHQGIADSELHVVPGAGHLSYVEARDDYLAAVRTFLRVSAAGK